MSFLMGPPILPPSWLTLRNGRATPLWLLNQVLAPKWLLRLCSNNPPWNWLVPEGVMKVICDAPAPKAGFVFEVEIVISETWSRSRRLGEKSTALVRM